MNDKEQKSPPKPADNTQIKEIAKKQDAVEKRLIGELFMANSINDVLAFTHVYISYYLPLFAYAVRHWKTNEIASMLNTSILIDRILYARMNRIIKCQVESDLSEFLSVRQLPQSSIVRLLDRQTSLTKAYLSSQLLFMSSFVRSALFSVFCDRKLYLNYGIGWSNLLLHFVDNPHLSFLIDQETLEQAERELSFIERDLKDINGELEKEINAVIVDMNLCSPEDAKSIPKHFVGLKLDWLKSRSLLSYCKYLKTNEKKHIHDAIRYSEVLVETLSSHDIDYHPLSFRDKISFPGPSPFIKSIIGKTSDYSKIIRLFNYIAYFESSDRRYVLVFPTNLTYYLSSQSTLPKQQQALIDDEDFLLECHKKGCFEFLYLLDVNAIRPPNDTEFYQHWMRIHSAFMTYEKSGLSSAFLREQLKHSASADLIAKEFEKKIDRTKLFINTMAMTVICGIDNYAEARGFFAIPAYAATTIPLITHIIVKTIYRSRYESLMLELTSADEGTTLLGASANEYESIQQMEESLNCIDSVSEELLDLMNSDVLKEVNKITGEIRQLIKSTKSIDEINARLAEISAFLDSTDVSSEETSSELAENLADIPNMSTQNKVGKKRAKTKKAVKKTTKKKAKRK